MLNITKQTKSNTSYARRTKEIKSEAAQNESKIQEMNKYLQKFKKKKKARSFKIKNQAVVVIVFLVLNFAGAISKRNNYNV